MATGANASVVSVKPAKFDENSPTAWFAILEAQFNIAGITVSKTQFYHALSHLPTKTVSSLDSALIAAADYDRLKTAVIDFHEATKPELIEEFIRQNPLTGRPSHYLAELQKIAGKVGVKEDFVRHKFQQALPSTIGPIIATQKTTPLADLGKLADELVAVLPANNSVAAVTHSQGGSPNNYQHDGRNRQYSGNYRARSPHPNRFRDLNLQPFSSGQRAKVCRAHIFYGEKARTCKNWCHWPSKQNCVIQKSAAPSRSNSPKPQENSGPA